ncbi:hypothetical protein PG984_005616 [Apiospora sp. TS-2023a]
MDAIPPGVDLSQVPLAPNPSGAGPNFHSGSDLAPTILATGVAFMIVSLIFVVIRLVSGWKHTQRIHLDDYFCVLGELASIAYWFVLYELQVKFGTAKHTWDIAASTITPTVMKGQTAAQILTSIANPLVKGSILLFLVRLFGTLRWVRVFCYTLLAATVVLYGAYMISLLSFCIPVRGAQWDSALIVTCRKTTAATLAIGVCAVVIDTAIFVMPFLIVAKLHVQPSRKRGLAAVFLFGFLYTEIFGTVMVSCGPALSSFWFNIFVKSSLYSSLRSKLSLSRLYGHSAPSIPAVGHHADPENDDLSPGQGHADPPEHPQKPPTWVVRAQ